MTSEASRQGITHVEVRNATKLYGATVALRGASARFASGQVTLIEGPNGSGKSTLLGLLSTCVKPTMGDVLWQPFGDDPALARPHIGWLGHEALVYPELPGIANLVWYARLYGLSEQAVEAVRQRLGIGSYAERPVRTMSRGQKQRIAIARALLHRPSLLLLDEPTTGLDRDGVALVIRIAREEAEAGNVVVIIAHDAGLAARLGARVVRIERGSLRDIAPAGMVQKEPLSDAPPSGDSPS